MFAYAEIVETIGNAVALPVVPDRTPVKPYAVIVRPGSPWLTPDTLCGALEARYVCQIVGPAADTPEVDYRTADLVAHVLTAITDHDPFTLDDVGSLYLLNIGGVDHVAADLTFTVTVDL